MNFILTHAEIIVGSFFAAGYMFGTFMTWYLFIRT